MKEHPILFSTEMVKALLDGRKAQTRRVIKLTEFCKAHTPNYDWAFRGYEYTWNEVSTDKLLAKYCPYGKIGDRLWVKETHYRFGYWKLTGKLTETWKPEWEFIPELKEVRFMDNPPSNISIRRKGENRGWFKRPSIFMPRWASRITLEITDIRVQKVDEITEQDAIAEGFKADDFAPQCITAVCRFAQTWDVLNEKRGYGWKPNLWVWVINFKVVK